MAGAIHEAALVTFLYINETAAKDTMEVEANQLPFGLCRCAAVALLGFSSAAAYLPHQLAGASHCCPS